MKLLVIIVFIFHACPESFAQTKKLFKINSGEKPANVIPKSEVFSYSSFKRGTVLFKSDRYAEALLNYNSLYGDMQFIDSNGDTLGIDKVDNIKMVVIETDTFYYDKGYLKLIKECNGVLLAEKQYFSFVNRQKKGGFGELSSASIETYNTTSFGGFSKDLVAQDVLTLGRYTALYIGNKYNNFLPVNKKNLQEIYAKREKEIAKYLKENEVNFSRREDVEKLLAYFQDL